MKQVGVLRVPMTLEEIERETKLSDKLNEALPAIFNVKAIKGTEYWSRFKKIETIRHRIIHNKREDRIPVKNGDTLWNKLLSEKHRNYALDSYKIMTYFWLGRPELRPRWHALCPF